MTPVGALHEAPPLAPVAQINRPRRRREHQRAGIEHVRQGAGIILGVGRDLRRRDVAGRPDKFPELVVRHRRAIDPEGVDRHAVDRRFLGVMIVRTHPEGAAGNRDHVAGPVVLRWRFVPLGVGPQQRHGTNSRRARLRTDVPEAPRPAWVAVVPALTRRGPRHDFQERGALLELMVERAICSGEGRGRRNRQRESSKADGSRAGHEVESLRCTVALTNECHHCRLHFQCPFVFCPPRH